MRTLDALAAVIAFFEERRGRLYGFRFRDRADARSCAPSQTPGPADQRIGTGDGATLAFQLVKTYGAAHAPYERIIAKPVAGSVRVAVDGVEQAPTAFACDPATGLVTFAAGHVPATGAAITAGFAFDVPVRFDTDELDIDLSAFEAGAIPQIPLVEIVRPLPRDPPDATGEGTPSPDVVTPHRRFAVSPLPWESESPCAIPRLAAHLERGATTLCHCWKLLRRDGAAFGFTDHDRDLAFGGTIFAARTGLEAAEATAELGFAVGGGEVSGALVSAGITEDDLAAGLFDDASVETWLVNWADPAERLLLDVGVDRRDPPRRRRFRRRAARRHAPPRRGARPALPRDLRGRSRRREMRHRPRRSRRSPRRARRSGPTVRSASRRRIFRPLPRAGSRAASSSGSRGANAGLAVEIKAHRLAGGEAELDLWQRAARPIAVGDTFRVTAGCDKRFATCGAKFANVANFRGFPHMPGNDFVLRLALQGEPGMDGGSLFR